MLPEDGKTHLLIQEQEPGFGRTMSMLELNKKDFEDSLINDDDITRKTKLCMFIKLYFALFIKFFFISIIVGSSLIFKIIDEYLMDKKIILAINIESALIIFIISISLYFVPKEYRHYKKIYIFSLLYNLCIITNCLILSKYINYKIIFICLFLISLQFYSIGMFIFIFKNYNCYGLLVTPFITNIISIIIIYFFYIHNFYQIINVVGFTSVIILSNYIIFYILIHAYKTIYYKEYIFIGIIINLSIFNLIGLGIYYFYLYIDSKIKNNNNPKFSFYLKTYFILSIEYIFIFIIFYLDFYYQINTINTIKTIILDNLTIFLITFISILFLICISLFILLSFKGIIKDFIIFFLFICCIIISLFLLSKYVEKNILLYCLIIILFNAISIEVYLIFSCFNKKYEITFLFISIIVISLTIFILYKFWIKEFKDIIYLSIFGIALFLLNNICHFLLFDFYTFDNALFKVMIMHLPIFAFIYMLIYKIQECIHSIYNHNITIKIYLLLLNLFLLIQYLTIAFFVYKFHEYKEEINEFIIKNIIYVLFVFAFPPFLFYSPCYINKNTPDNWKTHFSLSINILCYIINIPIMIILYLFLLYYLDSLNIIYLLSFIIILISIIEIFALLFIKIRRSLLIIFSSLLCICLSFLFYSYFFKVSIISYILASLYYINLIASENLLSNSCNYDRESNLNFDKCFKCNCIRNRQGFNLKFYDIFYSISFINLIKYSPLALIYAIPLDLIRMIAFPLCKIN